MTGAGGDSGGSGGGGQQRRRGGGRRRRHQVWVPWPDGLEGGGMNQQNCEVGGGQALEVLQLRAGEAGKALPADPFSVHEAIRLALGEEGGRLASARPESVSGTSYTLVATAAQKELLVQKLTKIGELEVVVEEHPTRNRVRCVVWCPETNGTPTQRLEEELAKQGVVGVYRHQVVAPGQQQQQQQQQQQHQQQQQPQDQQQQPRYTGTMVLTVRGTRQPSHILFGMLRVPARPYRERPMQCGTCRRFGHKAATCPERERGPVCGRCSERHTAEEQQQPCQRPPYCRRCGKGSRHTLDSPQCPALRREQEIAEVRGRLVGGATFAQAQRHLELEKRQQQQQKQQKANSGVVASTSNTSNNNNNSNNNTSNKNHLPSYAQMAANGLGGSSSNTNTSSNINTSSNNNNNTSNNNNNTSSNNNNTSSTDQPPHQHHQYDEALARVEATVERVAKQLETLAGAMETIGRLQQQLEQQQKQQAQQQLQIQQLQQLLQRAPKQKLARVGSEQTGSSKKKKSTDGRPPPPAPNDGWVDLTSAEMPRPPADPGDTAGNNQQQS